MTAAIPTSPKFSFTDANGAPLVGGKLYTYQAGTTSLLGTWQDRYQTLPNTNPIILDARGEATIWLDPTKAYKFSLRSASDALIYTQDDVTSAGDLSSATFTGTGSGAVARSVKSKLGDFVSLADYSSMAQAKAAANGTPVWDPAGGLYNDQIQQNFQAFFNSGQTIFKAGMIFDGNAPAVHPGVLRSVLAVTGQPVGSTMNGPTSADMGLVVSVTRKDYLTVPANAGEIDGVYVVTRNSGSNSISDNAGILVDAAVVGASSGFCAVLEGHSALLNTSAANVFQLGVQIGVVDPVRGNYIGFYATASVGTQGDGILIGAQPSSRWTNLMRLATATQDVLRVRGDTGAIEMVALSGATPTKTLRSATGQFQIIDDSGANTLFAIGDTGLVVAYGGMQSTQFNDISGNKLLGARVTGYTAWTGTPDKASVFDVSTATAAQIAARVAQIQADLTQHGLIH